MITDKNFNIKYRKEIINFFLNKIIKILNRENNLITKKIKYISKKKYFTDPVTKFDISIERKIRKYIVKKFPKHNIFGEELEDISNNSNYNWFIDPIDGTKALIAGQPTWSNLIGFNYKNIPQLGLANYPILKKFYFSDGKKSYLIENNNKKLIRSSSTHKLENSYLVTNSIHTFKNKKVFNFFKNYKFLFKITGVDSYNFCLLAEGKIDIIIESGLKKHDIIPVLPILLNSGAVISDWKGGNNYLTGEVIVSANKKLHKKFLNILNQKIK